MNTFYVDPPTPRRHIANGFTIGEMLVYMVIAGLVLGGVYRVMTRQGRGYGQQIASNDVDESARGAAAVLAWDLRHAGMAGDTLMSLSADSIVLRSVQGVGVVCNKKSTSGPRYAIWKTGGDISAATSDSAIIYRSTSSSWRVVDITNFSSGASTWGMGSCLWSVNRTPDLAVQLDGTVAADTSGIDVGSPFRAFRSVTYKAYTENGRTWLGRRVGSTGTFEKLTGPLQSSNGLAFAYLSSTGGSAASPSAVVSVKFTVRTESYKQYRKNDGSLAYRYDSLSSLVTLRR